MSTKTNYETLGRNSLEKLKSSAENAGEIQKDLLCKILKANQDTSYGQKYGFSEIASFEEYQSRVPLSTYEDYEPYVARLLNGEKQQLTAQEPIYYCITSGSIGEPKYQPLTESDLRIHHDYAYGAIFGIVKEYYPSLSEEELFGNIFQVGEFAKTFGENGVMNGVRSASLYQWLDRDGGFDASNYCVPKEVLFPDRPEDLTYIRARFALAARGITAIHGVFVHKMTEMFRYIEEHWEILLDDMENGKIAPEIGLSDKWKEKIVQWLPPNPKRAAELRKIPRETLAEGMIEKIWSKTRYVLCIGGVSFSTYMKPMLTYTGSIPIHYFAYAATEGIFGIAYEMNRADAYVLLPEAGIFEFLPIREGEASSPVSLTDVQIGEEYELIFTNLSGLYRYRMMDVVKVTGFFGRSPVIRFCYRINQVLNIADEKLNMEQILTAMKMFGLESGLDFRDWCIGEDTGVHPPRYRIYIESAPCENAVELMECCLRRCSVGYDGCRNMNEISPPKVLFIPDGSFSEYEKTVHTEDTETEQIKPLRLLNTERRQKFFLNLIKGEDHG